MDNTASEMESHRGFWAEERYELTYLLKGFPWWLLCAEEFVVGSRWEMEAGKRVRGYCHGLVRGDCGLHHRSSSGGGKNRLNAGYILELRWRGCAGELAVYERKKRVKDNCKVSASATQRKGSLFTNGENCRSNILGRLKTEKSRTWFWMLFQNISTIFYI